MEHNNLGKENYDKDGNILEVNKAGKFSSEVQSISDTTKPDDKKLVLSKPITNIRNKLEEKRQRFKSGITLTEEEKAAFEGFSKPEKELKKRRSKKSKTEVPEKIISSQNSSFQASSKYLTEFFKLDDSDSLNSSKVEHKPIDINIQQYLNDKTHPKSSIISSRLDKTSLLNIRQGQKLDISVDFSFDTISESLNRASAPSTKRVKKKKSRFFNNQDIIDIFAVNPSPIHPTLDHIYVINKDSLSNIYDYSEEPKNTEPVPVVQESPILIENTNDAVTKEFSLNKFDKFDIGKIRYNLAREYSQVKSPKDKNFLKRMTTDVGRRQNKENMLNKLMQKRKVTASEDKRVKVFNRLIDDANKRSFNSVNNTNTKPFSKTSVSKKSVQNDTWESVYNKRFLEFQSRRDKKLEEKIILKEKAKKEEENKIIEEANLKLKKAPSVRINKIVNRLHHQAYRKELAIETRRYIDNRMASSSSHSNYTYTLSENNPFSSRVRHHLI